jgi:hypothetical protein
MTVVRGSSPLDSKLGLSGSRCLCLNEYEFRLPHPRVPAPPPKDRESQLSIKACCIGLATFGP